MRILFYGAGVIGSVYAATLQKGGHDVSVLARGERLATIREQGVRVESVLTGERTEARVHAVETLAPDDAYDLIVVAMQSHDVEAVLPVLSANLHSATILFLGNNAAGPDHLVQALGEPRVLLGFPSVGGYFDGPVVRFAGESERLGLTLGELDDRASDRRREVEQAFAVADVDVTTEPHIDAWLKAHVALVLPILFGLDRHGLDNEALARDRATMRLVARAVREGLGVLEVVGYPIRPLRLRTITWLPTAITAFLLGKIIASDFARVAFAGHAAAARGEFALLLDQFRRFIATSGCATPALDELCAGGIHLDGGGCTARGILVNHSHDLRRRPPSSRRG